MSDSLHNMKDKLRQLSSLKAPLPEMDFETFLSSPYEAFAIWAAKP